MPSYAKRNLELNAVHYDGSFFSMLEKSKALATGKTPNSFIDPEGNKAFLQRFEKAFRDELKRQQDARTGNRCDRVDRAFTTLIFTARQIRPLAIDPLKSIGRTPALAS